jgi:small subunit ribosomal protein S6
MRSYELAYIVNPNIDEEGVKGVIEKVSQYVQAVEGKVTSVDVWGRKPLAYPINNHKEGIYVLVNAQMSPSTMVELERNLKLLEPIIRYLLVVKDEE